MTHPEADAVAALARRVERLTVARSDPEAFFVERGEIAADLRRLTLTAAEPERRSPGPPPNQPSGGDRADVLTCTCACAQRGAARAQRLAESVGVRRPLTRPRHEHR